jgi:cell division protein FtsI (penicillin-binding protein 3)
MSIGYELQMPPMYVLAFYNAIANDGKMIAPKLVKSVRRNGVDVKVFPTETVKKSICSEKTLGKVRQMLIDVVEKGTAKAARSEHFKIAGKTGTAQVDYGKSKSKKTHQLTFCGYFPADDPKYSIIVVVWYPSSKFYPSAGAISGEVFKNIAERLYAVSPLTRNYIGNTKIEAGDAIFSPATKDGNYDDLVTSLGHLGVDYAVDGEVSSGWCRSSATEKGISIQNQRIHDDRVPNVVGMGAKDAVFLMENRGLVVKLEGVGAVASQSIEPGLVVKKGTEVKLELK